MLLFAERKERRSRPLLRKLLREKLSAFVLKQMLLVQKRRLRRLEQQRQRRRQMVVQQRLLGQQRKQIVIEMLPWLRGMRPRPQQTMRIGQPPQLENKLTKQEQIATPQETRPL
jgi:hypothetical protein